MIATELTVVFRIRAEESPLSPFSRLEPFEKIMVAAFSLVALLLSFFRLFFFIISVSSAILSAFYAFITITQWLRSGFQPEAICPAVGSISKEILSDIFNEYWCSPLSQSGLIRFEPVNWLFFAWHPLVSWCALAFLNFMIFVILVGFGMIFVQQAVRVSERV